MQRLFNACDLAKTGAIGLRSALLLLLLLLLLPLLLPPHHLSFSLSVAHLLFLAHTDCITVVINMADSTTKSYLPKRLICGFGGQPIWQ